MSYYFSADIGKLVDINSSLDSALSLSSLLSGVILFSSKGDRSFDSCEMRSSSVKILLFSTVSLGEF